MLLRQLTYALLEDMPQAMREALDEEVGSDMTSEAVLLGRGLVHGDVDCALAALRSVHRRGDVYLGLLCRLSLVEIGDDSEQRLAEVSRTAQASGIGRATRTALGPLARRRGSALPRLRPARDELSEEDVRLTGMIGDGAANRQIAALLACSEKTFERLTQVFQRTGCRSRAELAAVWLDGSLAGRDRVPGGVPGRPGIPSPALAERRRRTGGDVAWSRPGVGG